MLLLLGSDGNNVESPIAKRFGHADYYLLYNTETNNLELFHNNNVEIHPDSVGKEHDHKNLQQFIDKGVEVFIVGNIGPYAFEIINTPNSKVYLARKMSIREAIEKYLKGELEQLTEPTAKKSIGHEHK